MTDTSTAPTGRVDAQGDFVPETDELIYERRGTTALLTFNRPQARNAMTFAMYQGLHDVCEHVDADERIRVLVLQGAGDQAFVAGTDIAQFRDFATEQDVLDYEHQLSRVFRRLEAVAKPTIAMIRGYCVGGGALIATSCDMRIATPDVRFGVPIARTLGNMVSSHGFMRVVALIGAARTKEVLFTARFVEAAEGLAAGLFNEIVEPDRLEPRVFELANLMAGHAPLTLRATKEAIRRILEHASPPEFDDLILLCYMSEDFKEGVNAFLEKRPAQWRGR